VDLTPSSEQLEITTSSAGFLRDRLPVTVTRSQFGAASNVDDVAWADAAELGWFSLGLPVVQGGVGGSLADEALLLIEIGRSLASGPFLSTVLGARVAAFGADAALAEQIANGRRVGMAIASAPSLVGADGLVTGELQLLDAESDGLVLVVTPDRSLLVAVSDLNEVTDVECIDPAVRLKRVVARSVKPLVILESTVDPVALRGHVLVAAMLTGITEAVRDISAEHAKNRVQFDRPIGVNQAVKHPCAEMAVQAQLAYAQTMFAALCIDEGRNDAELHALSAHMVAFQAAETSAAATIQLLGGMGFTFEHDAQLYVKRAYVLSMLFGGTSTLLNRLLALPESTL
jgi:alkylation response protein AidB-like acyl-CoA dehydrogenase